jgi:hypothetical protein
MISCCRIGLAKNIVKIIVNKKIKISKQAIKRKNNSMRILLGKEKKKISKGIQKR